MKSAVLPKQSEDLDFEWVLLIKEAKSLGLTKEEILSFLRKGKSRDQTQTS